MTWWIGLLLGLAAGVAVATVAYAFLIRPWHMRWGTTDEEVRRPLPGDDLVARPKAQATHAITIRASAADIWPWLVQMGQGRGGFYSYDWLENLFGCDIRNADRIVPEWQRLQVGDGVRLHPKAPPLSAVIVEPQRAIVLAGGMDLRPETPVDPSFLRLHTFRAYTWAFILDERGGRSTRLIARVRGDWDGGLISFIRNRIFMEPAHSIMQRRMNLGIKERVEAALENAAQDSRR